MKTKAELAREMQDKLQCNHCKAVFTGTLAQALRVVYEGRTTYCSEICRKAFMREKFSTPVPNRGPCESCGDMFQSRREAKFCGMKCYTGSKQFTEMIRDAREKMMTPESLAKNGKSRRKGVDKPCLECGKNVYEKKSSAKKYCSKVCYRAYMAKRFDRQIANPETISLPQGYDGFLDRELLRCLIDGCDWQGHHLSLHMNQVHGITADELKRAAGFNKGTGLVSKGLAIELQGREKQGVALLPEYWANGGRGFPGWRRTTPSYEAREHISKARALAGIGPLRACVGCGCDFQQSTIFGMAKYCTKDCRAKHYSIKDKDRRRSKKATGAAK